MNNRFRYQYNFDVVFSDIIDQPPSELCMRMRK